MDYKESNNKEDLKKQIRILMSEYTNLLVSLADHDAHKSAILYYWLKEYKHMLKREAGFKASYLKEYSRGDIINVNLGFNPGSEQGGLHYAIVIEDNPRSSNTVTIIPLRSMKEKDSNGAHWSELILGDEIYKKCLKKITTRLSHCKESLKNVLDNKEKLGVQITSLDATIKSLKETTTDELENLQGTLDFLKQQNIKLVDETRIITDNIEGLTHWQDQFHKMKTGSVALIKQITTVSKIRIKNPTKPDDILSDIKLSTKKLNDIDTKLKEFYIYK